VKTYINVILFIALSLAVGFNSVWAQTQQALLPPDTNQFPSEFKWYQVESEFIKIFYTKNNRKTAGRILSTISLIHESLNSDLGAPTKKITLVLNPVAVESNGYVGLAPRKSEWFSVPFYDSYMGNSEWMTDLAVHEYRHVLQLDRVTPIGTNRYFHFILGEIGSQVGAMFTMPRWFAEGDAVVEETVFTRGGRGRQAMFNQHYRALRLEKKTIKFEQDLLGSYNVFSPDHYEMGFILVNYLRRKYSKTLINSIINDSAGHSYNMYSFYNSLKSKTGHNIDYHYKKAMDFYFAENPLHETKTQQKSLTSEDGSWTSYLYPQWSEDGGFISLKYGQDDYLKFVKVNRDKSESKLFAPSMIRTSMRFHYSQNKILYSDKSIHPRWNKVEYSDLAYFDMIKKNKVTLTYRGRFFHPRFNFDNTKIVAVQFMNQQSRVIIFDVASKTITQTVNFKYAEVPSYPVFYKSGVVVIVKDISGAKRIDYIVDNKRKTLHAASYNDLADLSTYQDDLYLSLQSGGTFNIAKFDSTAKFVLMTDDGVGCYQPSMAAGKLLYNCYRSLGKKVFTKTSGAQYALKNSLKVSLPSKKVADFTEIVSIQTQDQKNLETPAKDDWFNMHSWVLLAPPLSPYIEFTAVSNNVLNTISFISGVNYNVNDFESSLFANIRFLKYAPQISVMASHNKRKLYNDAFDNERVLLDEWHENEFGVDISLYSNQFKDSFLNNFDISIGYHLLQVNSRTYNNAYELSDTKLGSWQSSLRWARYQVMSSRDLNPAYSQALKLTYKKGESFEGQDNQGEFIGAYSKFYFPGFKHHHSFFIEADYEQQLDKTQYRYSSKILDARGISIGFIPRQYKSSWNYSFPIAYPDHAWGDWFYWSRISLNLFYDNQIGDTASRHYYFESAGIEVLFDFNFLRFEMPLNFGLRSAFNLDKSSTEFEVFINTQISSF
jgi:hypothetical protein